MKMFGGLAFLGLREHGRCREWARWRVGARRSSTGREAPGDDQGTSHGDARPRDAGMAASRRRRRADEAAARTVGRDRHHLRSVTPPEEAVTARFFARYAAIGPALDWMVWPWGLVRVISWSALPVAFQPPSWRRWWWCQQTPIRFDAFVGPCLVQCCMWWTWRMGRVQPAQRQLRLSRAMTRRRSQGGGVREARPMPTVRPSGVSMLYSMRVSQRMRQRTWSAMGWPLMVALPPQSALLQLCHRGSTPRRVRGSPRPRRRDGSWRRLPRRGRRRRGHARRGPCAHRPVPRCRFRQGRRPRPGG